jgi:sialate O-acetylesterase
MKRTSLLLIGLLLGALVFPSQAQLKLPKIFSDHMVLQRDQEIVIWGWSQSKDCLTIALGEQTAKIRAEKDGSWRGVLQAMPAGGPYTLRISSRKETLRFDDVWMGDVWICSGQSNMEWPLSSTERGTQEIDAANHPKLRLFNVERNIQFSPAEDLEQTNQWQICSPQTAARFSAVGFHFGKRLKDHYNVPIGLISTNWGGTEIETWISGPSLEAIEGFEGVTAALNPEAQAKIQMANEQAKAKLLAGLAGSKGGLVNGRAVWAARDLDESAWKNMAIPQLWENDALPNVDGVVWFRYTFNLSEEVASRDGTLSLGSIDDTDYTYVNGVEVGRTVAQYNKARSYQVAADLLRPGKNVITVRVHDTGGGGGMWGDAEAYVFRSGNFEKSLAGNWKYRVSPVDLKIASSMGPNSQPTLLYNGMIAPLLPYGIKGAIWYQGESNAGRAYEYRTLFPAMIKDWRKQWGYEFPFFWVQLANFRPVQELPVESAWAELREAQSMTLSLPKTGQAVIIDIGEADDIHPRNKRDVGERLYRSALHIAYGEEAVHSGPVLAEMKVQGNQALLSFQHVGGGLVARDKYGYLKGFAVAGEDRKWYWAQAWIEDDQVVVSSPQVNKPAAVRYAWADNPEDANLYNQEGLPASPFRTDDWPGVTQDVHRTYPKP